MSDLVNYLAERGKKDDSSLLVPEYDNKGELIVAANPKLKR